MHVRSANDDGSIFSDPTKMLDTSATENLLRIMRIENSPRYRKLFDRTHTLSIDGDQVIYQQFYKKLNHPVKYLDNQGTNVSKGQLYLLFVSTESTNTPTISYMARGRIVTGKH